MRPPTQPAAQHRAAGQQQPGRGSENKVPFVAAVSLNDAGNPLYAKVTPVSGFTSEAIAKWARSNLTPGADVLSDGLACFAAVTEAGCTHRVQIVGQRKPRDLPQFKWVNTVLGNLKTMLSGAYKAFAYGKYAERYLGAFAYRFNRRFDLADLVVRLIVDEQRGQLGRLLPRAVGFGNHLLHLAGVTDDLQRAIGARVELAGAHAHTQGPWSRPSSPAARGRGHRSPGPSSASAGASGASTRTAARRRSFGHLIRNEPPPAESPAGA
jgi:hypothetical protein